MYIGVTMGAITALFFAAIVVLFSNADSPFIDKDTRHMRSWVRLASVVVAFVSFGAIIGYFVA